MISLLQGRVGHARHHPFKYTFEYSFYALKLDLSEFHTPRKEHGLGLNCSSLVSVQEKDFGPRDGSSLNAWACALLQEYGLKSPPHRIEMIAFPRYLGHSFNPLSLFVAYDADNLKLGVIAEVSNTFNHWHHYVLVSHEGLDSATLSFETPKTFHVSPFMNMHCHYQFECSISDTHYDITINETSEGQATLSAWQSMEAIPLSRKALTRAVLSFPWNSFKVLTLIHWWALKIWMKGGHFHKTPKKQQKQPYSHSEMTLC